MFDQWSEIEIPDQSGRVAVITGGNGGLGFETARALAAAGAHVVMAARNLDKAESATGAIVSAHPAASVEVVGLDLGSLDSVTEAASTIARAHPRIDLLINNAGIMAVPEGRTADGFESQFGTNHLGHFALTAGLLPALLAVTGSRVVTVTSTARHLGRSLRADRDLDRGRYDPWLAYGRSKLANLHFAVGLHRRLTAAGGTAASLVAHPGLTNTDLQATSAASSGGASQKLAHGTARFVGMSPARGALSQLRAATDPRARSGELYAPRFVNSGSPVARPLVGRSVSERAGDELWAVSERETGVAFDVEAMVRQAGP
ncbi:MAG: oxidoreductase [Acidimicrobiales bacterium]|nr:oxidoreductase [Acidimicrobiales bacterium]